MANYWFVRVAAILENDSHKILLVERRDDVSEVQFFKANEIPYDRIAFEGLKKAIKKFIGGR